MFTRQMLIPVALVFGTLMWLSVQAKDTVTFRYLVPDGGITLIETSTETHTSTVDMPGGVETTVSVTTEKKRFEIVKTAKGFTITNTLLAIEQTVDGENEELDGFDKAMLACPGIIELDQEGRLLAVKGVKELREKILELTDGEKREIFERLMTVKRMEYMAKTGYTSAIEPILGLTKQAGDRWSVPKKELAFSSNLLAMPTNYTLISLVTVGGRACAQIKSHSEAEAKAAAQDLRVLMEDELAIIPKEAKAKFTVQTCTVDSTSYVDPQTMVAMQEHEKKVKKYRVTVDDHLITFTDVIESTSSMQQQ